MSITTDLDVIGEAVVTSLNVLGFWGARVRQVEDPEAPGPLDYAFPYALVFDMPTDFELKNSAQDFMLHQFGIAVFVSALEQEWSIIGAGGSTVGRRAMQKAIRDHFKVDNNPTLGGIVHLARISRHEPGKRVSLNSEGDTDPGVIVAVSVLDVSVFQAG